MSAVAYVLIALASYRIARAITVDTISAAARGRVYRWAWDDDTPIPIPGTTEYSPTARGSVRTYLFDLVSCPVCMGVWVSAAVYATWRWWANDVTHAVIAIFAVAGLQCLLAVYDGSKP